MLSNEYSSFFVATQAVRLKVLPKAGLEKRGTVRQSCFLYLFSLQSKPLQPDYMTSHLFSITAFNAFSYSCLIDINWLFLEKV